MSASVYGRLNHVSTDVDGYTEDDLAGAGLGMRIDEEGVDSLVSTLGWRGGYAFSTNWGVLLPQLRVDYEHEFEDDELSSDSAFLLDVSNNIFSSDGDAPDQDRFVTSAGLVVVAPRGWSAFIDLEFLLGDFLY